MIEQILQIDGFIALYIFMLAAFVGYEIIGKVPAILHTPLMSGSNFIHGIVLVGAMIALGQADTQLEKIIGFLGVFLGAGNAVGGYVVTERMLEMFKSSKDKNHECQHDATSHSFQLFYSCITFYCRFTKNELACDGKKRNPLGRSWNGSGNNSDLFISGHE